jgi:hypothetical protein
MSAVATRERAREGVERGSVEPPTQRLFESQGPTLEDSILATWQDLTSADRATCPVCSGEMTRSSGCSTCGTKLG